MIHSDFLIRAIHLTPKPAERPALFSRFWGLRLRRYLDIPNCILSELWQSREIIVPSLFKGVTNSKGRDRNLASAPRQHTSSGLFGRDSEPKLVDLRTVGLYLGYCPSQEFWAVPAR